MARLLHVFNSPTAGAVPGGQQSASRARGSAGKPGGLPGDPPATVLLRKLQKLWQRHPRPGLKVRHETGKILNDELGSPTQGDHWDTLRRVAPALRKGMGEFELSKMRWFAHYFGTMEDLKAIYPRAERWSWDQLEACLTCLMASVPVPQRSPQAGSTETRVRRLHRLLKAVTYDVAGLDGRDFSKNAEDWYALLAMVEQMLGAVSMRFNIHIWGNGVFDLMKKKV